MTEVDDSSYFHARSFNAQPTQEQDEFSDSDSDEFLFHALSQIRTENDHASRASGAQDQSPNQE